MSEAGAKPMRHVSFTKLRASMAEHFDRVEADRAELVVTRQNHEPMVVMPLAELEGLRETLHLLGTPANAEHLLGAIRELEEGKGVERTLIEE
jgi:antitoxin YefM